MLLFFHYDQLFSGCAHLNDGQNRFFSIKIAFSCAFFLYTRMRIQQNALKRVKIRKSSYFILPTVSRRLVVLRIKQHISKAYISLNKTNTKSFTFNWKMALFYLKRRVRVLELKMRKKIIFHKKTNISLIVFSRAF